MAGWLGWLDEHAFVTCLLFSMSFINKEKESSMERMKRSVYGKVIPLIIDLCAGGKDQTKYVK
jgi:hypothetical protein